MPSTQPTVYQVGFDANKYSINLAGQWTIANVAAVVEDDKAAFVTIVGRADTPGSADYNTQLSQRRATAVRAALVATGKIAPNQILTAWTGHEMQSVGTVDGVPETRDRVVDMRIY